MELTINSLTEQCIQYAMSLTIKAPTYSQMHSLKYSVSDRLNIDKPFSLSSVFLSADLGDKQIAMTMS